MAKDCEYHSKEWAQHMRKFMRKKANKARRRVGRKVCEGGKVYKRGR